MDYKPSSDRPRPARGGKPRGDRPERGAAEEKPRKTGRDQRTHDDRSAAPTGEGAPKPPRSKGWASPGKSKPSGGTSPDARPSGWKPKPRPSNGDKPRDATDGKPHADRRR